MHVGLLGGTFDPPHLGHLILAERVRETAGLGEVRFLPSFQPPHKDDDAISSYDDRTAMTALAIDGHPHFKLETIEKDLPPPSYTTHTLVALRKRNPTDVFSL